MAHDPADRLEVYARATRGLMTLEPDREKQYKYMDFIDIYMGLDENEQAAWRVRYPEEEAQMKSFAERFREEGVEKGLALGESRVLRRQLTLRFGQIPEAVQQRIEAADADTLLLWSERVLTAQSLDDIFAG